MKTITKRMGIHPIEVLGDVNSHITSHYTSYWFDLFPSDMSAVFSSDGNFAVNRLRDYGERYAFVYNT